MRDTGAAAYTDGTNAFVPQTERIEPGSSISGERIVTADVCVIGTGAGGAVVAKELAEGGMRVVMLEDGERFTSDDFSARPRDMSARLYRDAGQTVTVGNVPIVLPLGQTVGGTTTINSGTCFRTPDSVLEHWQRRLRPDRADPRGARPVLPPRRAHHQRRPGPARAGRPERARRQARRRRARLVERLPLPQRARLRRLRRVRVRLPDVGQAVDQPHLRPARVGRGGDDLHRHARRADRARERPGDRRARDHQGRRHGDGQDAARDRRLRRHPHAAVPAPQRPRRRVRRARRQPRDPPGDRRPRAVRRGDRHGGRRAAVVLHRRVRRRADHLRGRRRAARLPRDVDAVQPRAPPRPDAAVQAARAVRDHGVRRQPRERPRALRPPGDPLQPGRRRRRRLQARHRAADRALLRGRRARRLSAGRARRRADRARRSCPTSRRAR